MPPEFRRTLLQNVSSFAWDERKSEDCFMRRGFDFAFACHIFRQDVLRRRDTRHRGAVRHQCIGRIGADTLFVVYEMRGRVVRIISARYATMEEERAYDSRFNAP